MIKKVNLNYKYLKNNLQNQKNRVSNNNKNSKTKNKELRDSN